MPRLDRTISMRNKVETRLKKCKKGGKTAIFLLVDSENFSSTSSVEKMAKELFLDLSQELDHEQCFDKLASDPETKKLKDSIAYNKGLIEQPYVSLTENLESVHKSKLEGYIAVVREGNRRRVALELILRDIDTGKLKLDRKKFETFRAWVYPKNMPEEHILLHIASMHNQDTGKKVWLKLNQAAYITNLRKTMVSDDDIVKGLQISKSTLAKQARAYEQTVKYGDKYGKDDLVWKKKYSAFENLFAISKCKDWCSEPKNIDMYMAWISGGRIPYAHKISKIKTILLDPKLLKKFTEARKDGPWWTLDSALIEVEKTQKMRDSTKQISVKCDQAVTDLIEFLPLLPIHKLEELADDKLMSKYAECISQLQKCVDTVNAIQR